MKLIDLNRDGGIGANSMFVQLGDLRLLIDCGLHPKKAGRGATPDLSLLRGQALDLIIITHCHLDHIGSHARLENELGNPISRTDHKGLAGVEVLEDNLNLALVVWVDYTSQRV